MLVFLNKFEFVNIKYDRFFSPKYIRIHKYGMHLFLNVELTRPKGEDFGWGSLTLEIFSPAATEK